mgnify:CR=1 FL=1
MRYYRFECDYSDKNHQNDHYLGGFCLQKGGFGRCLYPFEGKEYLVNDEPDTFCLQKDTFGRCLDTFGGCLDTFAGRNDAFGGRLEGTPENSKHGAQASCLREQAERLFPMQMRVFGSALFPFWHRQTRLEALPCPNDLQINSRSRQACWKETGISTVRFRRAGRGLGFPR